LLNINDTDARQFSLTQNEDSSSWSRRRRNFMRTPKNTKTASMVASQFHPVLIIGILNHQIEFSKAIQEIYKPISGRASDPNSAKPEGNAEGIKACEEYEAAVQELQETLKPELEMLETRIIQPAIDLLAIVKQVQKMLTKRNHKLLDYDRLFSTYAG
jgi:amphiphysin